MKKILLLATGGTIASRPTAAGGLAPAITSEELLACVPELADLCAIDAVQLFNLDSTNVGPAQWQEIVRSIRENYAAYDGFVIAHGTDTMAYTAAALSYLVQPEVHLQPRHRCPQQPLSRLCLRRERGCMGRAAGV